MSFVHRLPVLVVALVASFGAAPGSTLTPDAAPAPILLGETDPRAILNISPEWRHKYDGYHPAAEDVAMLRLAPKSSLLKVYFGSWCSDSREGVPHLLTALDVAGTHHLKAKYYAVDRSKKEPADLLEGVGLEYVPTIVLTVNGREIGRIVEAPRTTMEHDLALLVKTAVETSSAH
jgi:thiol-disulfide isomerase/thioredoxin